MAQSGSDSENRTLTQANKQNKLQACTKEEFLLLFKKQNTPFLQMIQMIRKLISSLQKTLSTQY